MTISETLLPVDRPTAPDSLWPELQRRIGALRYGSLEITVEDAQIIQIELSVRSRIAARAHGGKFRRR